MQETVKDLLQEMGTRLRDGGKLDEWILMADVSNLADGSITLTHIYIYIHTILPYILFAQHVRHDFRKCILDSLKFTHTCFFKHLTVHTVYIYTCTQIYIYILYMSVHTRIYI